MTDEELAGEPGALATRPEDDSDADASEPVFSPKDFRLNLGARLAPVVDDEPLPNLDSPAIRKLTWEHVVPDRPASSAPSVATLVPLPPPRRVPPPPPQSATSFQPPAPVAAPSPAAEREVVDEVVAALSGEPVVAGVEPEPELVEVEVEVEVDDEVEAEVVAPAPVAQPEVNRLAYVPDLEDDDDSPIELPPITPSGPVVTYVQPVYAPVLAETLYIPPPTRTATAAVAVVAPGKSKKRSTNRKPKRHLFRSFMTLVVLFGLLAGGAFAAKKYLLHQPTWSAEMKPLADEVAASRGLQFKVAVDVTSLPAADYATRLATSTLGAAAQNAPAWRALGVVNGELDLGAIGRQAMNDTPAFYEPTTKTILVSDDLRAHEHLYRFALHRALTAALLDQQFAWSTRVATAAPAVALAVRATIDGDALAVANALAANDGPDLLAPELLAFVQGHGATVAPSQYAATIVGRPGVAMRPSMAALATDPTTLSTVEQATPSNDAVFDAVHAPSTIASPAGTQGMIFWYYVLASRIDDGQAWSAAVHWVSDSLATSTGSASQCVDAKVGAADVDGATALLSAFEAWAAAAPAESTTTVVPIEGNMVAIRACDPGAAVSAQIPTRVPVVFGGAGVEQALVQAADSAAGAAKVDAACLVSAARLRGTALTSPADDAPVLAIGWQPPYVAANLDLAAGCVAGAAPPAVVPAP